MRRGPAVMFANPFEGAAAIRVRARGSRLRLPVAPGAPIPPSPSLRSEPCREYVTATNQK